ncbi:TonB-like protein [Bdellovibrio bacteriovorus str. Tiberius]|uniref:TonB-like protein n=1 Tax=Bdellovibrio bacteriovorus str. Tiberius TaxID=1069642 RepID=K7ZCD8_BDEBC|nr:TonB-like protein [Bdellovibrio bacteriovorus str. Tiberius]
MHLLAVTALQWGASPMSPDLGTVVDLTVTSPAGVSGLPPGPAASVSKPAPTVPAESAKIQTGETTAVAATNTDNTTATDTTNTGTDGGGGDSTAPVGFSEITRLPKVKREFKAQYPEEAKKAAVDGPVILEILIDREGKVRHVQVLSGPGHGLNESAVEALKKFEFQPAFKGEESVAVRIRYTYRFKLEVN